MLHGKLCPSYYCKDEKAWNEFKNELFSDNKTSGNTVVKSWQTVMNKVYGCGLDEDGSYGPASKAEANKHQLYKKRLVINRIRNDYVRWLQNRLRELGFYKGSIDGSFWKETDTAVRNFQRSRGLKADGYVGANTVKELLK